MFERLSEWMSATSFAIRRVRLEDMVGSNMKMNYGGRVVDGIIVRRVGCKLNKDIVATRPKAALCCETRR